MERKKLISILTSVGAVALGLILFLISQSHINKALKKHERLASGFSEMYTLLSELKEAGEQGGKPQMLSFVRENKSRAAEAANKMREACDYYEKVRVPSALKSKLSAVREGIPEMRRFLDSFEGMFKGTLIESEFNASVALMGQNAKQLAESGGFVKAEADFIIELKRLKSRTRRRLIWL